MPPLMNPTRCRWLSLLLAACTTDETSVPDAASGGAALTDTHDDIQRTDVVPATDPESATPDGNDGSASTGEDIADVDQDETDVETEVSPDIPSVDASEGSAGECEPGCADCCGEGRRCMDIGTPVCGEVRGACQVSPKPCGDLNSPTVGLTTCDGNCARVNNCESREGGPVAGRQYFCILFPLSEPCDLDADEQVCPDGQSCVATECRAGVCVGGCISTEDVVNDGPFGETTACSTSSRSPFEDTGECWPTPQEAWLSGYNGLLYWKE
jgi:hypothetical protein